MQAGQSCFFLHLDDVRRRGNALGLMRDIAIAAIVGTAAATPGCSPAEPPVVTGDRPPNIVIINADDLGWGDLGSYGHPTIDTPRLDRMAAEGQRWTSFYAQAPVCSPSRAALLTGRLPVRSGMFGRETGLFWPDSLSGLPAEEITLAEALREAGYATAIIGKWHLGHLPEYLPMRHEFDSWFGIPYSNDMDKDLPAGVTSRSAFFEPDIAYWQVPLMRNDEVVERPAEQTTITRRYTEEAVRFIRDHRGEPFFLYLPHTMPHLPIFASEAFRGRSDAGLYGDVIEEIDWGVGQILDTLDAEGLADNTLVVFTSDNGPWLSFKTLSGSAGPLRHGKGTTFEGGMRVPAIFWWPNQIAPAVIREIGSAMDLFTTALRVAGLTPPKDRPIDGVDLSLVLFGAGSSPRETMAYYRMGELYAFRQGAYKVHFITEGSYGLGPPRKEHNPPLLFNLNHDPGERFNVAKEQPDILAEVLSAAERHRANVTMGEPLFDLRGER